MPEAPREDPLYEALKGVFDSSSTEKVRVQETLFTVTRQGVLLKQGTPKVWVRKTCDMSPVDLVPCSCTDLGV